MLRLIFRFSHPVYLLVLQYALGYCSSGEHYDCWVDGDGRPRLDVTILGCGPFPGTEPNMTAATTDEENDVEDINGWICGKYGELLKCPGKFLRPEWNCENVTHPCIFSHTPSYSSTPFNSGTSYDWSLWFRWKSQLRGLLCFIKLFGNQMRDTSQTS